MLTNTIAELSPFDAWLFDLDGTLANTMSLHHKAYSEALARHGGLLSRADFNAIVGPPARVTIPRFIAAAGLSGTRAPTFDVVHADKKRVFEALVAAGEVEPLEAAYVARGAPERVKVAVVTSGNRAGASAILRAIGLADRVEYLVSGDDVARGKPDPEPFLAAATALCVAPEACLVFEDHADGIAAAWAAGMTVLNVTTGEVAQEQPA